jgi:riboflavin kinase/FMN adenylyltransferase
VSRAVAIGTFDGVHLGHRRVLEETVATGLEPAVVTLHPHPRVVVLGHQVELISSLERRIELIREAGIELVVVVEFTSELSQLEPEEFVERHVRPLEASVVVAGDDFRFGRHRRGDLGLLESLGFEVRRVAPVPGVSSTEIRRLMREGDVRGAARLLGRPLELDGVVVSGDARGGTLGFPTANLAVPPELAVPGYGIYAGAGLSTRAAVSIGTNPHYGGAERRVEAFLLDFEGDLYGKRLVIELWERLRDERAFGSEQELVDAIAADVEATRRAVRPSTEPVGSDPLEGG